MPNSNHKLTIGLTGGIASGKSSVSNCFIGLGIDIIDTDKIAKQLFAANSPHLKPLRDQFGNVIFLENGELDRKTLAQIVFENEKHLNWLNQFTHPLIATTLKVELNSSTTRYRIIDIPLLIGLDGKITNHLESLIDRILVVNTHPEIQIERLIERDGITLEEALKRIGSQSSLEQKLAFADDVIDNNQAQTDLLPQVKQIHQKYLDLCLS